MKTLFHPLAIGLLAAISSLPVTADTLADIYELSLKNDAQLKSAEASYRANLETENEAFSQLLPQVTATASYSEFDHDSTREGISIPGVPISPDQDFNQDGNTTEYGVNLQQKLFDLPVWFTFKQGKELSAQAEAQFAADQQALIIRVANVYFDVLRSLDNLQASKAEERATKRQLEQTQQRFDVGLIAITDVHEAKAVFDDTVVRRLTDEGNLGTAYEAITVLTGLPHSDLWLLHKDFPIVDPDPISRGAWVEFALLNNYTLKAAIYGMEASRQAAASKKMEHLPKITGDINYVDQDNSGDQSGFPAFGLDSETDGTTWSVNLSVPLFAGGGISASRRKAYEQYNATLQTKINTQRVVVQSARSSHITTVTDVQRVNARAQAILSTSSALDATQAGYEVGTRNIVDVLQAQRSLYSSIRDYSNSRYDYVVNLLQLKQAAGILTPQDVYDINKWIISPDSPDASQYNEYLKPDSTTP